MSKKDNRFEVVKKENISFGTGMQVIRDKQTGVHYLFCGSGYGGGLTPLLDSNGEPTTNMR